MGAQTIPMLFVTAVVLSTIAVGMYGTRLSRTTSDFYVAGRGVGPLWNSSAITGEYLSAASFMGIAGMLMKYGFDVLWYAVGYAAGFLVLLLFIAGPLRRFGAYTIPDFAHGRLESLAMRKVAVVFVLAIGFFYMMPQLKGAGITLAELLGTPYWVGVVIVAGVIAVNVSVGGMKGITLTQAFQHWVKQFAIMVPLFVLMAVTGSGYGANVAAGAATHGATGGDAWMHPFGQLTAGFGQRYALLYTVSLVVALLCGTAGLPHVLVRLYTNPDSRRAKTSTLMVLAFLSLFYVFPAIWGAMGRAAMPSLLASGDTDLIVIRLPEQVMTAAGMPLAGQVLSGIMSAGAFAAFMTTFSGLLVSVASGFAHDIYARILKPKAPPAARLAAFQVAAAASAVLAVCLGLLVEQFAINMLVGWAFAIAASTFFPLLLLGVWHRGLTPAGAMAGMVGGGAGAIVSVVYSMLTARGVLAAPHPLIGVLAVQPAIWTVPLSIGLMLIVSRLTHSTVPAGARLIMLKLHAPEQLGLKADYIKN